MLIRSVAVAACLSVLVSVGSGCSAGGAASIDGGGEPTGSGGAGDAVDGGSGSGGSTGGLGGASGAGGAAGGTGGGAGGGAVDGGAADAGSGGGAGTAGSAGGLPPGYPMPTASNEAVCRSVAQVRSPAGVQVCPGGGAGPSCVECLLGGSTFNNTNVANAQGTMEAGNYAVSVTLGGPAAAATQVKAETNRELLSSVPTASGQSITYGFVVNVRAKEGQPTENVSAGYPGLDLFFSGPAGSPPVVSAIGYALVSPATKPVMVYVASDSTACDQSDTDYAGWGQMLPWFFAPPVGIANYADSGESSGSFLGNAAEWGAVKNAMAAGDWVLIQFGHNDGSTTSTAFRANITTMVSDAKAKGITPVLVSPPARATFTNGVLDDQSSLHAADMKAVATAENVAFIDLTSITSTWYTGLGSNGWQQYHALGTDKTHTNTAGAEKIAGFVSQAITTQNIGLARYTRM